MEIAARPIGSAHPPYVIALLSANHNGDIERAFAVMEAARRAWCHRYARTATLWQWHWAKALWQLAREPGIAAPIPDPDSGEDIRRSNTA